LAEEICEAKEVLPTSNLQAAIMCRVSHEPRHVDGMGRKVDLLISEVQGSRVSMGLRGLVRLVRGMDSVLARGSKAGYVSQ
jgi:hypothetical protein